ncbi:MAG: hypothetical protein VYE73_13200 [Acidobacteriota bacterium]|nr:hypothetical protein [Acidobacteriota bacterium]
MAAFFFGVFLATVFAFLVAGLAFAFAFEPAAFVDRTLPEVDFFTAFFGEATFFAVVLFFFDIALSL